MMRRDQARGTLTRVGFEEGAFQASLLRPFKHGSEPHIYCHGQKLDADGKANWHACADQFVRRMKPLNSIKW